MRQSGVVDLVSNDDREFERLGESATRPNRKISAAGLFGLLVICAVFATALAGLTGNAADDFRVNLGSNERSVSGVERRSAASAKPPGDGPRSSASVCASELELSEQVSRFVLLDAKGSDSEVAGSSGAHASEFAGWSVSTVADVGQLRHHSVTTSCKQSQLWSVTSLERSGERQIVKANPATRNEQRGLRSFVLSSADVN